MRRWTIPWRSLLLLAIPVAAIVFLLILPDVDPPDTAFHLGTAPTVVHARTNAAPVLLTVGVTVRSSSPLEGSFGGWEFSTAIRSTQDSLLVLHRSLRL